MIRPLKVDGNSFGKFIHKVKIRNVFANNVAEKYMMYGMMKLSDRQDGISAGKDKRRNVWIFT